MSQENAASPLIPHHLEIQEQRWLAALRTHRKAHRDRRAAHLVEHALDATTAPPTRGQRLADSVARVMGSWAFIAAQSAIIVAWITFNSIRGTHAWDVYPFLLLNLLLSFQAAYTAPAIMMSQNRQSEIDRRRAENDYEINIKAELEIELLHQKLDLLKEKEILALAHAVEDLSAKLTQLHERLSPRV